MPNVIWLNQGRLIEPVLAPSSSWYKGTTAKNTITEISLVDFYTSTGTETESWDASAAGNGSVMAYIDGTKLMLAGNGYGKIFANADSSYAFSDTSSTRFSSLTTVTGMDLLDTSKVTNMKTMFYNCSGLTGLDVSGFDTSQVTDMSWMFAGCSTLTGLDLSGFDISQVTLMRAMFQNCNALVNLDVSGFKTSNVTDMAYMFQKCNSLNNLNVSGFNTSKVVNMSYMFQKCNSLTYLDVSGFKTSLVTTMLSMFDGCEKLTVLDVSGFDTSKTTNMSFMFGFCSTLTGIDLSGFDTSQVTDMSWMFNYCPNLTTIYASELWSTANITNSSKMFSDCIKLVGQISYDSSKIDATYANYTTGYFTYKAASAS